MDCHIDTSNGAGIQPMNAAKNAIPSSVVGKTCFISNEFVDSKPAKNTAKIVLIVSNIITNFIMLSKNL